VSGARSSTWSRNEGHTPSNVTTPPATLPFSHDFIFGLGRPLAKVLYPSQHDFPLLSRLPLKTCNHQHTLSSLRSSNSAQKQPPSTSILPSLPPPYGLATWFSRAQSAENGGHAETPPFFGFFLSRPGLAVLSSHLARKKGRARSFFKGRTPRLDIPSPAPLLSPWVFSFTTSSRIARLFFFSSSCALALGGRLVLSLSSPRLQDPTYNRSSSECDPIVSKSTHASKGHAFARSRIRVPTCSEDPQMQTRTFRILAAPVFSIGLADCP